MSLLKKKIRHLRTFMGECERDYIDFREKTMLCDILEQLDADIDRLYEAAGGLR